MSDLTSENIGYTRAGIFALLAIVVAYGFLLNKQEDGSKKLRPVAIMMIILAVSAGTFSTIVIYLDKQVQVLQVSYRDSVLTSYRSAILKSMGEYPRKSYGPISRNINN